MMKKKKTYPLERFLDGQLHYMYHGRYFSVHELMELHECDAFCLALFVEEAKEQGLALESIFAKREKEKKFYEKLKSTLEDKA